MRSVPNMRFSLALFVFIILRLSGFSRKKGGV